MDIFNWYNDNHDLLLEEMFSNPEENNEASLIWKGMDVDNYLYQDFRILNRLLNYYCVAEGCDGTLGTAGHPILRLEWKKTAYYQSPFHQKYGDSDHLYKMDGIGARWHKPKNLSQLLAQGLNEGDFFAPPSFYQVGSPFLALSELKKKFQLGFLIEGVIQEKGINLTYGAPASGKSFIKIDQSMCIAAGIPWHGLDVKKGNVLYIATEGQQGLNNRVEAWLREHDLHMQDIDPHFRFYTLPVPFMDIRGVKRFLIDLKRDWDGFLSGEIPSIIIVDTFADCLGMTGGDENSSANISLFFHGLKHLASATGSAIDVIHHPGKNVSSGPRGSNVFTGAVDTQALVEKNRDKIITITFQKQKNREVIAPMRFQLKPVSLGEDEVSCVVEPYVSREVQSERAPDHFDSCSPIRRVRRTRSDAVSRKKSFYEFILSNPAKYRMDEICRHLDISESSFRNYRNEFEAWLIKNDDDTWSAKEGYTQS